LPAWSLACTLKVWLPPARPVYVWPLEHDVQAAPSSWQAKLAPVGSLELKLKPALVEFVVAAGPAVIEVSGGVVSIVQVKLAGIGSALPAASVAVTWKVCDPGARPVYACGLVQAAVTPSSEQLKLEPDSVEVKEKLAPVAFVGLLGLLVIVVSGALVSIVHVAEAGVASVLPAASVARTEKVWLVAPRPL
jgi:hypothetical protein